MMRKLILAAMALAVSACAGRPEIAQAPGILEAAGGELPVPASYRDGSAPLYQLGPYDKIIVEVTGLEESRREITLDGRGVLSYPLAGSLTATGLTTSDLAAAIEQRLRANFVRDPQVNVNIDELESKFLTVDGQVQKPGLYPVTRELTLMQAVATAGGQTENARVQATIVFREVEGQQYVGLYDLEAIRHGNYPDPRVYPDDKIVVSYRNARALVDSLTVLGSLVISPLILLLR